MFCASSLSVFAQNEDKTVLDTVQTEVQQVIQEPIVIEKSIEEELREAQSTIKSQQEELNRLKGIETNFNQVVSEKENIEIKKKAAEQHAFDVEKSLISMASNFLYVPYEAYGVEEIAVKAFESIQDQQLKQEYNQRYILLKNYQLHLKQFKAYLEKVQKECNGVFQATATEFIDMVNPTVPPELILKNQPFYQEYIKYTDYKDTYIGGLIVKTEAILRAHTKAHRANMQEVITSIDNTLTPAEIDSVDKIIITIDERLKTIENL